MTPKPSLPGIIGSLGIGGAIVGSGSHGSTPKPDSKQPGTPGQSGQRRQAGHPWQVQHPEPAGLQGRHVHRQLRKQRKLQLSEAG
ncbi:hypothetical protein [Corynebacterium jeikeium]|uniref:hypothetical protein n=1 Tax=Corynebacterium jeikeium TaxID=38289 RepID=UPI002115A8C6|nr:hypothetical protein [Corynebacterium jeikeium]